MVSESPQTDPICNADIRKLHADASETNADIILFIRQKQFSFVQYKC